MAKEGYCISTLIKREEKVAKRNTKRGRTFK